MNSEICKQCKHFNTFSLIKENRNNIHLTCYCINEYNPTFISKKIAKSEYHFFQKHGKFICNNLKYSEFTINKNFSLKGKIETNCPFKFEHEIYDLSRIK
jgi:hypothetical protein